LAAQLKYLYNKDFISRLCSEIQKTFKQFDSKNFTKCVFDKDWDEKELKERMRHITESLYQFLPKKYSKALKILKPVSKRFSGFEPMFFPDYVEQYGIDDIEESIVALEHFTKYSSSEFAVRPFIVKYPKVMMRQMELWASSNNHHVRRLASEGCRPRLPWAMALPVFKKDPKAVMKVLRKLKNDTSEYVRRSVANNLNDIAKDNPEVVIKVAKSWLSKNKNTDWLVKHACRTLLKQGQPEIMRLFDLAVPDHIKVLKLQVKKKVSMGERLNFSFQLETKKNEIGKVRIEFGIDFMKSNGKQARKIFKISEVHCEDQRKEIQKYFSFKPISTRKYYPGAHGLAIIVNGHELACGKFKLLNQN